MTPKEEGYQAAKDDKFMTACPYNYSQMDMPMYRYIQEQWDAKRDQWGRGWRAYHDEHSSTML